MIPLLPDFPSAQGTQAMPQQGISPLGGAASDREFAGLLDAALPDELASLTDGAAAPALSAPSLPTALQPELPSPPASPSPRVALSVASVALPPGGTIVPVRGGIVPGAASDKAAVSALPLQSIAARQGPPSGAAPHGLQRVEEGASLSETAEPSLAPAKLQSDAPLQVRVAEPTPVAHEVAPIPLNPPQDPLHSAALSLTPEPTFMPVPVPVPVSVPLPAPELGPEPVSEPEAHARLQPSSPASAAAPARARFLPAATAREPATDHLTKPLAGPSDNAAPPPPTPAVSLVQAPASPPPAAMPSALAIAVTPESFAVPDLARSAPAAQLEQTIAAVGDLREALRAARPEMTLRHAEFGAVSLRVDAAGPQDWRVVLASRDPGFVPAIQAALAERAVAAAAETSLGSGGQHGGGEPRYGSSPGSGQGGSQAYLGQHPSRDEGGLAHHQQQRHQRGNGLLAAAADNGAQQSGGGTRRDQGLFA